MIDRRFSRDERGATAVEFAFILFPMLLVFFGTFEFARALQTNNNLNYAAGMGSRAIMIDNAISNETLSDRIRGAFIGGNADLVQISHGTEIVGGSNFRTLTVSYPFHFVVDAVVSDPITLSVSRKVPTQ